MLLHVYFATLCTLDGTITLSATSPVDFMSGTPSAGLHLLRLAMLEVEIWDSFSEKYSRSIWSLYLDTAHKVILLKKEIV